MQSQVQINKCGSCKWKRLAQLVENDGLCAAKDDDIGDVDECHSKEVGTNPETKPLADALGDWRSSLAKHKAATGEAESAQG